MKKIVLISLSVLLSIPLLAQFKGKMVFTTMNKERHFDVYSSDAGYRYDFDEDGRNGSVIVKSGSQEVIILMPQQKNGNEKSGFQSDEHEQRSAKIDGVLPGKRNNEGGRHRNYQWC